MGTQLIQFAELRVGGLLGGEEWERKSAPQRLFVLLTFTLHQQKAEYQTPCFSPNSRVNWTGSSPSSIHGPHEKPAIALRPGQAGRDSLQQTLGSEYGSIV